MNRRLLPAIALSLFAPAASATGQEMAGVVAYLIVLVSIVSGLALGGLAVVIILLLSWRRGTLRQHPVRMAVISCVVIASGPILVFLSFMVGSFAIEVAKYPRQYPWLTGVGAEPVEVQQPTPAPAAPRRDLVTAARERMGLLAQDVVRWWYYDPDVEDAERRASGGN